MSVNALSQDRMSLVTRKIAQNIQRKDTNKQQTTYFCDDDSTKVEASPSLIKATTSEGIGVKIRRFFSKLFKTEVKNKHENLKKIINNTLQIHHHCGAMVTRDENNAAPDNIAKQIFKIKKELNAIKANELIRSPLSVKFKNPQAVYQEKHAITLSFTFENNELDIPFNNIIDKNLLYCLLLTDDQNGKTEIDKLIENDDIDKETVDNVILELQKLENDSKELQSNVDNVI